MIIYPSQPNGLTREQLLTYAIVIVAFSGGKDSVACVLHLLEMGVPRERIELWHHDVDGREGSNLMDWAPTRAYCQAFADALGLRLFFSWKQGGFEGEMLRENAYTRPTSFETPSGLVTLGGGRGKQATRRVFPQVTANLSQRWCSAYLKIDVGRKALNRQERFRHKRVLFVTGERAEESKAREHYAVLEPHACDARESGRLGRHVDAWRPVHRWTVEQVWAIIEAHRINPHPAYKVGLGRTSCQFCIFGSPDQWATVRALDPERFSRIAAFEAEFKKTIKRKRSVTEVADRGTPYPFSEADAALAQGHDHPEPIVLQPGEWRLPLGAFASGCGPT